MGLKKLLCASMTFLLLSGLFAEEAAKEEVSAVWPPKNRVKIIHLGWMNKDLDQMARNIRQMEEEAPFDGLSIHLGATSNCMHPRPIKYDEVRGAVNKFKRIRFRKYTDNFLITMIDQTKPNWLDDKEWKIIASNWGVAAKAAKKAGMVGIMFDPECYGIHPVTSYWRSEYFLKTDKHHTAEDYRAAARRHGREMGKAIFKEFEDIQLLGLYLYSMRSDLLAELVHGMLEVIPPTAKIHDGNEWQGYIAQQERDYLHILTQFNDLFGFADYGVEKQQKTQFKLAPSFYMDTYCNAELTPAILTQDPTAMFFRNFLTATKISGGYIWLYGERGSWWKDIVKDKAMMWDAQLPGAQGILTFFTTPEKLDYSRFNNLFVPDKWKFLQAKDGIASGSWKKDQDIGTLNGSGAFAGFRQEVKIKEGMRFLLSLTIRYITPPKKGEITLRIVPMDEKENVLAWDPFEQTIPPPQRASTQTLTYLIEPLSSASVLSIRLRCKNFQKSEKLIFSSMKFYELDFKKYSQGNQVAK